MTVREDLLPLMARMARIKAIRSQPFPIREFREIRGSIPLVGPGQGSGEDQADSKLICAGGISFGLRIA